MKQLKEIYDYREMIFSLVKKDLRGRYKGSVLGFLWTFINPLLQLVVFTLVFSIIMRAGYEQYYLFLFVALVPWMFFASSVQDGSTSILREKDMVKKIYFPREVLPIATVTSSFVNMLLTFIVIFIVLLVSGRGLNPVALLCLPIVMIVQYILCLGIALIVASLTVYFRDLQYILGIVVMALQYMTPVMFGVDMVENAIQERGMGALGDFMLFVFNLNPMTPIINIYRQIMYYKQIPDLSTLFVAFAMGIIFIIIGNVLFKKLQRGFAENF
ncbi:MAG: ABC transporter permease [Eubacteriales bacterium]|nr:ABC transporter permease [Eubacteriales bacterium]